MARAILALGSSLLTLLALAPPLSGQACSASDFGSTTLDPIVISGTWDIGDFCTLDFGDREVVVDGTLKFTNTTIRCGRLYVLGSGKIEGTSGGSLTIHTQAGAVHAGDLVVEGKIFNNASVFAGDTFILVDGDLSVAGSGKIEARGTGSGSNDGGTLQIEVSGSAVVDGALTTLDVSGDGPDGFGGLLILNAMGDLEVLRKLKANGYVGGCIELRSRQGSLLVDGVLDLKGSGDGCGGFAILNSELDAVFTANVEFNGGSGNSADGGGDAGVIEINIGRDWIVDADFVGKGGYWGTGGEITGMVGRDLLLQSGRTLNLRTGLTDGWGGSLDLQVGGEARLDGTVDLHGNDSGGSFFLEAAGPVTVWKLQATGLSGGDVDLSSTGSSLTVTNLVDASGNGTDSTGGTIFLGAATEMELSGATVDASGGSGSLASGGTLTLDAGGNMSLDAATNLRARGNGSNGGIAGSMVLRGCRITLPAGSDLNVRGTSGGSLDITAGDVLSIEGRVRVDAGTFSITTRLADPWSPILTSNDIVPAPSVTHDRTIPPCLAAGIAELTALTPSISIGQGDSVRLRLDTTVPNADLVVLAGLGLDYISLGPLGYQQVNPATAFRVADFGYYGSPLPNSRTDGSGQWNYDSGPVTNAGLIGSTIWIEAFVVDVNALNGLFHQPPAVAVSVLP